MASGKFRLQKEFGRFKKRRPEDDPEFSGLLGFTVDSEKVVEVPGRPGYVYVRLRSNLNEVVVAFNDRVALIYGFPVLVGRKSNDKSRWVVIGKDLGRYINWGDSGNFVASHAITHTDGGIDQVFITPRQIIQLGVFSDSGMVVGVMPGTISTAFGVVQVAGTYLTITAPTDANKVRLDIVQVNVSTGIISLKTGTQFDPADFSTSRIPAPDSGNISLAAVRSYTGQTEIADEFVDPDIIDLRWISSGSGGSVTAQGAVILYHSGVATGFPSTDAGIASANSASTDGDTISLPPGNFAGFVLQDGLTLEMSEDTVLTTTVTISGSVKILGGSITVSGAGDQVALIGGATESLVTNTDIRVTSSTGDAFAVQMNAGAVKFNGCYLLANASAGAKKGRILYTTSVGHPGTDLDQCVVTSGEASTPANWEIAEGLDANMMGCSWPTDYTPDALIVYRTGDRSPSNHTHALDGLSDVDAAAPSVGDLLGWSGSEWENTPAPSGDFVDLLDGPGAFAGQAGNTVVVNGGETALEYAEPGPYQTSQVVGTVLLDTTAGVSGTASFSVSSIPAGYAWIEIHLQGRTESVANSVEGLLLTFNSDTTDANYRSSRILGGWSPSYTGSSEADGRQIGVIAGSKNAGFTTSVRITIPNPGSALTKSAVSINGVRGQAATENIILGGTTHWESTAAITAITLTSGSDFAEGTRCTIVGYKDQLIGAADFTSPTHDHVGGDGAQIDHTGLSNIGTNTHAQIDTHLGLTTTAHGGIREKLSAARTYYVRTDGNDSNTGLANTAGGAFLTIQAAVNAVAALDINGQTTTIQIADGTTYGGGVILKNVVGYAQIGNLVIQGNSGTPANVIVTGANDDCFRAASITAVWEIKDMKLVTTTGGNCLNSSIASMRFGNIDFGSCLGDHIKQSGAGQTECISNYTVSGGAVHHMSVDANGLLVVAAKTITFSTNPTAFSTRFTLIYSGGYLVCYGCTFTNSAYVTGVRYYAGTNAIVYTGGGGANYFPGNSAGTADTGAQYI